MSIRTILIVSCLFYLPLQYSLCLDTIEAPAEVNGACVTVTTEGFDASELDYDNLSGLTLDGSCEDSLTYDDCVKDDSQVFFQERECSQLAAAGFVLEGFNADGTPDSPLP